MDAGARQHRGVVTTPSLSVVVPVHNAEVHLPDLLGSLERNAVTLPGVQVVAVDDGSDDTTADLLAECAATSPWLEVVRHDTARGASAARNTGLDHATGRYVTFLDGDDWIAPGYLRDLVAAMDGLGCDFVRVDHVQVRDGERVLFRAPEARRDRVFPARSGILPANRRTMVDYPFSWAGAYRRELGDLLRFRPRLHTATDRPWIWQLHREACSYAVVSLAGVFYRRLVATSLTQLNDERQLHFLDAYADVLAQVESEPDFRVKAMRQFLAILGKHLLDADARFEPSLRATLVERARALLAPYEPARLLAALPERVRFDTLVPVLPEATVEARRQLS